MEVDAEIFRNRIGNGAKYSIDNFQFGNGTLSFLECSILMDGHSYEFASFLKEFGIKELFEHNVDSQIFEPSNSSPSEFEKKYARNVFSFLQEHIGYAPSKINDISLTIEA